MQDHLNAARREAERVLRNVAQPRMGIISSYNADTYQVKVRLQPEDTETGWMPLASISVGNGWGLLIGPEIGAQVKIGYQEGHSGSPIAELSVFSDEDRPAVAGIGGVPSGEFWLVHKSGTRLRLLNDSTLEIYREAGHQATLNPDGSTDILGSPIRVGAEGAAFLRLLDERFYAWAIAHVHQNTGPPLTPPPLEESATDALRGA